MESVYGHLNKVTLIWVNSVLDCILNQFYKGTFNKMLFCGEIDTVYRYRALFNLTVLCSVYKFDLEINKKQLDVLTFCSV